MAPEMVVEATEAMETKADAPHEATTETTIYKTCSPLSRQTSKEAPRGGLAGATQILPTL